MVDLHLCTNIWAARGVRTSPNGREALPDAPTHEFITLSLSRLSPYTSVGNTLQVLFSFGSDDTFVQTAQSPELNRLPWSNGESTENERKNETRRLDGCGPALPAANRGHARSGAGFVSCSAVLCFVVRQGRGGGELAEPGTDRDEQFHERRDYTARESGWHGRSCIRRGAPSALPAY